MASQPSLAQPVECDNNFGQCGTPEMSGGGNAGQGSILINNTDIGDTYQSADDYDDDGIEDSYDNCPRYRNASQFDQDGDGIGDACDNCVTAHNLNQWDTDADFLGDLCDADKDGDGILNTIDNCPLVFNVGQHDTDTDGSGDACDYDIDNDGITNDADDCPMKPGTFGEEELCHEDRDGDGIPDYGRFADNCPTIPNPRQSNLDADGAGDECDPDIDGDMVLNIRDNCVAAFNVDQSDEDRDGTGDACDDMFCFVVFGDKTNCLDPASDFKVYSPSVNLRLGDTLDLRAFSNKANQPIRYTWSVVSRPTGSSTTVAEPQGYSSESDMYQHVLNGTPRLTPDVPGNYSMLLTVEMVFEDDQMEVGTLSQHHFRVVANGQQDSHTGCSVSGSPRQSATFVFILTVVLMFTYVNRRIVSARK